MTEEIIRSEVELQQIEELAEKGLWYINGSLIEIKNMTTEHIKNCIKYINEQNAMLDAYIGALEQELKTRGELNL